MLATDESLLEVNTSKILAACRSDFEEAASTGKIRGDGLLHAVLRLISLVVKGETLAIEELNSIIKIQSERCRRISLELLISRVMLKK